MPLGHAFRWNSIRPKQKVSHPNLTIPERLEYHSRCRCQDVPQCFKTALILPTGPSDVPLKHAFLWKCFRPMQKVSHPNLAIPERPEDDPRCRFQDVQQRLTIALVWLTWPSDVPLRHAFHWNCIRPVQKVSHHNLAIPGRLEDDSRCRFLVCKNAFRLHCYW